MEFVERVKHVESVHVNDGCVNCQLAPITFGQGIKAYDVGKGEWCNVRM